MLNSENCANLFGLPWLRATANNLVNDCLNIGKIECGPKGVSDLTEKFSSIFNQSLRETMTIKPVTIRCESQCKPVYRKARPLPLALQTKVKNELDSMVENRIIERVEWSEWASCIVPVIKTNGNIRICLDFKSTVNPCVQSHEYSLPLIKDIVAKLEGSIFFFHLGYG